MKLLIDGKLTIEPVTSHHIGQLTELVNGNRLYLREWIGWIDVVKTADEFERFFSNAERLTTDGVQFSGVIFDNTRAIGSIGLYHFDKANRVASIGYWVGEEAQGKGVITKACETIIRHGFEELGLNRIEIRCGTENYRSQAVPKRLGFQREGIVRQGELLNGRFIDLYLYSILKDEWKA